MYDTVNFWIDRAMVGCDLFTIAQYLTDITQTNSTTRGYTITGKVGDYSVLLSDAGISLKGSLPKFLLPTNIHTLTRAGALQAIEKLSDSLHLPIKDAKVTRIDISNILIVDRPPCEYYPFLGSKPHFERLQATKNTLYYNTNKKQLIFYNKIEGAKASGMKIPEGYQGKNLLRFEVRYLERLSKQFNRHFLTGSALTEEHFYTEMIKGWSDEYFSISKLKSTSSVDTSSIKTPNDAKDVLFSYLLQHAETGIVHSYLSDLKSKNIFTDPKYYTRLKVDLENLCNAEVKAEKSDLINELDAAVREVLINCR